MATKTTKKIGSSYYLYVDGQPQIKLNETGYLITDMHLNGSSIEEISERVAKEYDVSYDDALDDVREFIDSIEL